MKWFRKILTWWENTEWRQVFSMNLRADLVDKKTKIPVVDLDNGGIPTDVVLPEPGEGLPRGFRSVTGGGFDDMGRYLDPERYERYLRRRRMVQTQERVLNRAERRELINQARQQSYFDNRATRDIIADALEMSRLLTELLDEIDHDGVKPKKKLTKMKFR